MSQTYELQDDLEWDFCEEIQRLIELNPWAWQSIGAVLVLVGGVLSPVIGTLFIAAAWFINSEPALSTLNVFVVSFALTFRAGRRAHCLIRGRRVRDCFE